MNLTHKFCNINMSKNLIYDFVLFSLFDTQIEIHITSFVKISKLIEIFELSDIRFNTLNEFLCNNIWNKLCTITIVLIKDYKKYNVTIPPHILHELKNSERLVIDYQCKCFDKFPNFTWINLWEYLINYNKFKIPKI